MRTKVISILIMVVLTKFSFCDRSSKIGKCSVDLQPLSFVIFGLKLTCLAFKDVEEKFISLIESLYANSPC